MSPSHPISIVCSAHGFGHLGRQLALVREFLLAGTPIRLFTHASQAADNYLSRLPVPQEQYQVIPWQVDVGLAQPDSLTEDIAATRTRLQEVITEARIDALSAQLLGSRGVIVDVAPPALVAARQAGVPVVAMGNFDWAWIYAHYEALQDWSQQFYAWQAGHIGISLSPGPGLTGFGQTVPAGLLGRPAGTRRALPGVRGRAGLVCFGGLGLNDIAQYLPEIEGFTWVLAPPMQPILRPDCVFIDDLDFPDLLASVDVVFSKPGYGIYGECQHTGVPMVLLPRGRFPEAPYLTSAMLGRGDILVEEPTQENIKNSIHKVLAMQKAPQAPESFREIVEEMLLHSRPVTPARG